MTESRLTLATPIVVVGAGASGRAAIRLLRAAGFPAGEVFLYDDKPDRGDLHDARDLLERVKPRTLVVSPGVPLSTPWIAKFYSDGGVITSELDLAGRLCTTEKIVGVTGSLGKSTTVSLLGAGLAAFCPDAFVGGNLGVPFSDYLADVLEEKRPRAPWVVLELSSFQLENAASLRCEAAGLTFLSANHLERYPDLQTYYETKWNLVRATSGAVVCNRNGGDVEDFANAHAESAARIVWASSTETHLTEKDFGLSKLIGTHNRDNLALAYALGRACGWPESFLAGMLEFSGLAHRLCRVGEWGGRIFIDDSKATSLDSVMTGASAAVQSRKSGAVWLLLGGRDKKLPWAQLQPLSGHPELHFVFFGECGPHAQAASSLKGPVFPTLQAAMRALPPLTQSGDTVLLSPGGTSLDEFKNFEDRGNRFAQMAQAFWR